jgi:hypothetical protein
MAPAVVWLNSQFRRLSMYFHKRRAWLFAETQYGAQSSANLYSLVSSARANGLEPSDYLCYLLQELPKTTTAVALEALLPWNVKSLFKARRAGRLNIPKAACAIFCHYLAPVSTDLPHILAKYSTGRRL